MKADFVRIKMFLSSTLFCLLLAACHSSAAPAAAQTPPPPPEVQPVMIPAQAVIPVDELDAALREAAAYLNTRIPKGSKAVFLNIKSDYPDLSEYILSVLSENAVNDGVFSVVDRQQLDSIRAELDFQMSGEVSDESAQSIGKMLGAESIVSGTAGKIGSLFRVQVKAIAVQTAGVQGQWSRNVPNNGMTITALTERYAPAPAAAPAVRQSPAAPAPAVTVAPPAPATPAPAPPPTEKVYQIGEKGPAGGWVFYDKGVVTNGWRYMEAAPNNIGPAQWGANGTEVNGTSTAVGTGKVNTQRIVPVLEQTGDDGAALLCTSLNINGYIGWFLPSKDELNLMYVNLKAKGLGGFGNSRYWSSSEGSGMYSSPTDCAWTQSFSDGSQNASHRGVGGAGNKNNTYSVRAARAF